MARIRSVKPGFWDSPGTAKASFRCRLFYIAMWNWADDWGVGDANAGRLVSFAFPNDDDISAADFPTLRAEVSECYDVEFYEVDGRHFYSIPTWELHQRTEKKARRSNPGPDEADSPVITRESNLPTPSVGTSDAQPRIPARGKGEVGSGKGEVTTLSTGGERPPKSPYSAAFEEWWTHYPKRESKGDAWKAWEATRKARTLPDLAALVKAADDYARKTKDGDRQFIKLPAGWLRDRKWEDEAAPADGGGWGSLRALGGAA